MDEHTFVGTDMLRSVGAINSALSEESLWAACAEVVDNRHPTGDGWDNCRQPGENSPVVIHTFPMFVHRRSPEDPTLTHW